MELDLIGRWDGTFHTDGLWFTPNLFKANGEYVGGQGFGGPAQTADVALQIKWQGDYETFYYALKVSPFYGDLVGVQQDSIPISGFVNTYGFVKFSLYTDRPNPPARIVDSLDWGFTGYITTRGGFHTLAGNWSKTNWSEGVLSYQPGDTECAAQGQLLGARLRVRQVPGWTFKGAVTGRCRSACPGHL